MKGKRRKLLKITIIFDPLKKKHQKLKKIDIQKSYENTNNTTTTSTNTSTTTITITN